MTFLLGRRSATAPEVANGVAKPLVGIYGFGAAAGLVGLRVVLASVSASKPQQNLG